MYTYLDDVQTLVGRIFRRQPKTARPAPKAEPAQGPALRQEPVRVIAGGSDDTEA